VAPGAHQLQQHHEEVDEVEIEPERPHDRFLASYLVPITCVVHLLDLLGIIRRQTREDEDPDHRDCKLQCR